MILKRALYLLFAAALTASALSQSVQIVRRGVRRRKGQQGMEPMGFYDLRNDTAYFYAPAKPLLP